MPPAICTLKQQLFRIRLNCSRVLALQMFEGRPLQIEGPAMQKLRPAAEASCKCMGYDKVAVISRPQSWSCRHHVDWCAHITQILRTSAMVTVECHQCNFEGDQLFYRQPVQCVSECWRDVVASTNSGGQPCSGVHDDCSRRWTTAQWSFVPLHMCF